MEPAEVFVKCERPESPEGAGAGAAGAGKRAVGRLVDSTQADDRRMIYLVRDRPLLYARTNMPVASYHSQVRRLWREVADIMGWTVAEVRRKWSHIRNSYSRHLRNEIHGVRTGRGRIVSRWYLADELHFLREHMATDARPCPLSLVPSVSTFLPHMSAPHTVLEGGSDAAEDPETKLWYAAAPPAPAPPSDDASSTEPDENAAYFQFFRGIYKDYQELSPRRQRRFRRQCLGLLHRLLDGEDADAGADPAPPDDCDAGGG